MNRGVNGAVTADKKLVDIAIRRAYHHYWSESCILPLSKKDISNFKLRKGYAHWCSCYTSWGDQMFEFLDQFDFCSTYHVFVTSKALMTKAFDGRGNYTMGVTEQIIFPEIDIDKVNKITGLDITFVTTAGNQRRSLWVAERNGYAIQKCIKKDNN